MQTYTAGKMKLQVSASYLQFKPVFTPTIDYLIRNM